MWDMVTVLRARRRLVLLYPCCRVGVGALQGGAHPLLAGVDVLRGHRVGDPGHAELFLDLFIMKASPALNQVKLDFHLVRAR